MVAQSNKTLIAYIKLSPDSDQSVEIQFKYNRHLLQNLIAEKALHHPIEPAYRVLEGNQLVEYGYLVDGLFDRRDGPAYWEKTTTGSNCKYYKNGSLHCTTGPAFVEGIDVRYFLNNKTRDTLEEWMIDALVEDPSALGVLLTSDNQKIRTLAEKLGKVHHQLNTMKENQ
jgi:hypothetical protein